MAGDASTHVRQCGGGHGRAERWDGGRGGGHLGALLGAEEVLVDGTHGEEGGHGEPVGARQPVRQHQGLHALGALVAPAEKERGGCA